jgi:endonuclease/exonuclease/phosphatase (EEP) superfamily protein YafD
MGPSMWNESACEICGSTRGLDRHHVVHRKMGGSKDPAVHDAANLVTICRHCHTNLHEGPWELIRLTNGFRVVDRQSGRQVMRRLQNPNIDVPTLFHLLTLSEASVTHLVDAVPYLSDDQLVEAFASAITMGRQAWLVQAAILHEAQQRSTYGDGSLAAIARRFDISLRQAQKYALVWKVFFARQDQNEAQATEAKSVNIDAIVLDEPSWYVVAASESADPEAWLAYAQDRKLEDPRYTVSAFRQDIQQARLLENVERAHADVGYAQEQHPGRRDCPWVRAYCTRTGRPVPVAQCGGCEVGCVQENCETKPTEERP